MNYAMRSSGTNRNGARVRCDVRARLTCEADGLQGLSLRPVPRYSPINPYHPLSLFFFLSASYYPVMK